MLRLIEIRSYKLKPGCAAEFDRLARSSAVPLLLAFGMDVVAFGQSAHGANAYFLIRAYENLADLQAQQNAFYSSEPWVSGPKAQAILLVETFLNTVIWLSEESIEDLRRSNVSEALPDLPND
jgi:hypothetical protein